MRILHANGAGYPGADGTLDLRARTPSWPLASRSGYPGGMETPVSVRLDKWLWAVRLFKTRTLADAACHAGHVKIAGASVKSARLVRPGETLSVLAGGVQRTVKVLAPLDRRVGAALVSEALEDLTPAAEYERVRQQAAAAAAFPKGQGRPTKKHRRRLEEGREWKDEG